jgi:predicted DNA-binding transcriptional regulator YafY
MGPSSEAVEAAAEAIQSRWRMSHSAAVRNDAHAALAAALPIIRREIAEEIERFRPVKSAVVQSDHAKGWSDAVTTVGAHFARGEVSR